MRTIKFRGLRLDGKGWVYGDFINSLEYGAMIMLTAHCGGNSFDEAPSDYQDSVQVKPETVGQFTGLQDKNGVDIYEGDILSDVVESDEGTILSKEKVFWNNKRGAWYLEESFKQDEHYSTELGYVLQNFDYEVIGNIHEK